MVFFCIKVGILFDTTNTIAFNWSGFNTFHWQTFDMCLSAFGLLCHSSYDSCIHLIRSISIIFRPRQYLTENRTNMKFSSPTLFIPFDQFPINQTWSGSMTVVFFHHRFAIRDFLLYLCNGKGSTRVLPFLS